MLIQQERKREYNPLIKIFMKITNLINGYIKITYLNRTFVLELPYQVMKIIEFKDLSEDGLLIANCDMINGNQYIRYIDLSIILQLLEIDKILVSKENLYLE